MSSLVLPTPTSLILDTDGKPLQYGVAYYILPVVRGRGGGLTTEDIYVIQEQNEDSLGNPVLFFNEDEKRVISTSSSVKIAFYGTSDAWEVTHCNITYNYYISIGTTAGLFTVESENLGYKLRHNSINEMPSGDFGAILEDKTRYLFLSDTEPFLVMFRKCENSAPEDMTATL